MELYYTPSTGDDGDYDNVSSMKNSWRSTDYMRMGISRLQGIWNMNDSERLIEAFLPFVRYRVYLFDWDYIWEKHKIKESDDFKNYRYHYDFPGNGFYEVDLARKGFWYSTRVMDTPTSTQSRTSENMGITEDAEEYLRKIIRYCKERGIHLTLFISPIYESQLLSTEDYDVYLDSVRTIAAEYSLPLYDFNLVRDGILELETEDFYDIGHLNSRGAEKFTRLLLRVLDDGQENMNQYFYSSFRERMKEETPSLYGAYWIDGEETRVMKIAASDSPSMEFKVVLNRNDEEGAEYDTPSQAILQNFGVNREFVVPKDEHGMVEITWRLAGEEDSTWTLEFAY